MLRERLEQLNLPDVLSFADGRKITEREQWGLRRKEIQKIICSEEYGFLPPAPQNMKFEILKQSDSFCAGKVSMSKVLLTVELEGGSFSFPIYCTVPKDSRPCSAFLHINFRDAVPDEYMPTEEICDNGFAVISFCYSDVTSDNGDFSNGLADVIYRDTKRSGDSPGKIAMWAWAAMRAMDYIQTLDNIDKRNAAVVGHSRLGKTALLTGALDERFAFVISNDSGCSGAALSRGKTGETLKNICSSFPYWFCENYQDYIGREDKLPFDQHHLLSLIAPRKLYVASAQEDAWADPGSEFLSCVAVGKVYEFLGETGICCPDKFPKTDESLHEGSIGYHIRSGEHYLSRYDWQKFMEYINRHKLL